MRKDIARAGNTVGIVVLLTLLIASHAAASTYQFDSGSLQGWTMRGLYAYSTYPTQHQPNPFSLHWDDTIQYPNISDPAGNNLGSAGISTSNLSLPSGFPSGQWWFVDVLSPNVSGDPQFQTMTGLSLKFRGTIGSSVQILLIAERRSNGEEVWLFEANYAGNTVFHDINTDSTTNEYLNPYHWMNLYPQFGDLSDYVIKHVLLRLWGSQTSGSGKMNIDNVTTTFAGAEFGLRGNVTAGMLGELGNYIDILYETDFEDAPPITHARINFTGTNAIVNPSYSISGDYRLSSIELDATKRILDLDFNSFDPAERFRLFLNMNQAHTGTGSPIGADYVGGTIEITFAGLPGTCTLPLTGTFSAADYLRGTAPFSCGDIAQPNLEASPTTFSFGNIQSGACSSFQLVTLTNTGSAPVSVSSMSMDSSNFVLDTSVGGNACGTTTPVIQPSGSCQVGVSFCPQQTGQYYDEYLTIVWASSSGPMDIGIRLLGNSVCTPNWQGSVVINGGAATTTNPLVTLEHVQSGSSGCGTIQRRYSNNGTLWSSWEAYSDYKYNWNLTSAAYGGNSNPGIKTVYAQFRDSAGNLSPLYSDTIEYVVVIDADGDGFSPPEDCNDNDNSIYPGATERCDNKDNDCNASTVDGSGEPWMGVVCDGADSDLCPEGTYSCSAGQQVCSDNTPNNLDYCDGIDNDCNPATGDGSAESWIGTPCDGADADLCQEGSFGCSAGQQVCSDTTSSSVDVCDGIDNDCNPATADGSGESWLGDACDGADSDLCPEGTYGCSAGQQVCSDNTSNNLDYCDGIDNDCNPATGDGSAEGWIGTPCDGADSDLCPEGQYVCSAGQQSCTDTSGDNLEICDGLDNNCNGDIDEGLPTTLVCYDGDHDGYGNRDLMSIACGDVGDYVTNCSDCDDARSDITGCNTPPGDDPVTVSDPATGTEVKFPNITVGGMTTITSDSTGADPPPNFEVEDGFGSSYFNIECETADGGDCEWEPGSFVLVCFTWEEGDFEFEEGVSIWHENEFGVWEPVNCQPGLGDCPIINPDTENNRVCAYVDHLSWFGVFQNVGLAVDLKPGLNLIAYSGEVPQNMTTYDLLQALGTAENIDKIRTYSPSTGDYFTTYYDGLGDPAGDNRLVKNYFSVQVYAKNGKQNTFYYRTACGSTPLIAGKNEAGFNCPPDGYSAYTLLQDVGSANAVSIQRYNTETGMFETASFREDGTVAGIDFIIREGEGYNVFMRQSYLWSAP